MTTVENIVCSNCLGFGSVATFSVFKGERTTEQCMVCGGYGVMKKITTVKYEQISMDEMKVLRIEVYGH